ncbi:MAG: 30S ribosomal protein S6 [Planctomycetota bacterium]
MRDYEAMFVLDHNLAKKDYDSIVKGVQDIVQKHGGAVTHAEKWDERMLEYPIRGQQWGTYVLMRLQVEPGRVVELERDFSLHEPVLRVLVTVFDPKARPLVAGAEKGRSEEGPEVVGDVRENADRERVPEGALGG